MLETINQFTGLHLTGWHFGAFISAFLCCAIFRGFQLAILSENWPSVTGKIIESRIEKTTSRDADNRSHDSWQPVIRYEYEVGGRGYVSKQVAFFSFYSRDTLQVGRSTYTPGLEASDSTINKYPVGEIVEVFYNPRRPKTAVLENGLIIGVFGRVFLSLMMVGAAGFSVWSIMKIAKLHLR